MFVSDCLPSSPFRLCRWNACLPLSPFARVALTGSLECLSPLFSPCPSFMWVASPGPWNACRPLSPFMWIVLSPFPSCGWLLLCEWPWQSPWSACLRLYPLVPLHVSGLVRPCPPSCEWSCLLSSLHTCGPWPPLVSLHVGDLGLVSGALISACLSWSPFMRLVSGTLVSPCLPSRGWLWPGLWDVFLDHVEHRLG